MGKTCRFNEYEFVVYLVYARKNWSKPSSLRKKQNLSSTILAMTVFVYYFYMYSFVIHLQCELSARFNIYVYEVTYEGSWSLEWLHLWQAYIPSQKPLQQGTAGYKIRTNHLK